MIKYILLANSIKQETYSLFKIRDDYFLSNINVNLNHNNILQQYTYNMTYDYAVAFLLEIFEINPLVCS